LGFEGGARIPDETGLAPRTVAPADLLAVALEQDEGTLAGLVHRCSVCCRPNTEGRLFGEAQVIADGPLCFQGVALLPR